MKTILHKQNENCKQKSEEPDNSELPLEIPDSDCKPVFLNFNGGNLTSDAGVLLLKEVDRQIRLMERIANVIPDYRNQSYVDHTYPEMLRQRVAQIACGYEDANDCNPLRTDPSMKIFSGKNPERCPYTAIFPESSLTYSALPYPNGEVFTRKIYPSSTAITFLPLIPPDLKSTPR